MFQKIRDFELNLERHIIDENALTMVFLHDSLGCVALWRDFPLQLAQACGMNVLVYDRRGYGVSAPFAGEPRTKDYLDDEADILMELLAQNNIHKALLFGHSDGGTIALFAAAKYPAQILAVLSEGAHVFVEDLSLDGILNTKDQYRNSNLKQRLEQYHCEKTEALFLAWAETWLSPAFRNWNMDSFLPAIQCPVMVIQGTEDEFGSIAQVEAIAKNISGPASVCMVFNAGHSPHKQNEIWLIGECIAFLEKNGLIGE